MNDFFGFRDEKEISIKIKAPEIEFSIIKRLGKPRFWTSNTDFEAIMEKIYKNASKKSREKYVYK